MTTSSQKRRARNRRPSLPLLNLRDLPIHTEWDFFFKSKLVDPGRPIEIEIGTGKGGFLKETAGKRTETNWLGVDWASKYLKEAARRLCSAGLENVTLFHGPFEALIAELPPESVEAVHIYFPDPWHKKRHAKRRMIRSDSLQWIHRLLVPGGRLHLRTDVPPYFEEMLEQLELASKGFQTDEPLIYYELPSEEWVPTNYERRFLAEGFPCHAVTARKISE